MELYSAMVTHSATIASSTAFSGKRKSKVNMRRLRAITTHTCHDEEKALTIKRQPRR